VQSEFLFFIKVIRANLNLGDEKLDQLKREGPAEWNAERDAESHMFSEIETTGRERIEHANTRLLQGNAGRSDSMEREARGYEEGR